MSNEAMEQYLDRAYPLLDPQEHNLAFWLQRMYREMAMKAWEERNTEVDELQRQLETITRDRDELKEALEESTAFIRRLPKEQANDNLFYSPPRIPSANEWRPESPEDDDPRTMPVEKLCEHMAIEVMGWHLAIGNRDWITVASAATGQSIFTFGPDTNPLHTQMVKDKMRERGFYDHYIYRPWLPETVRHQYWWSRQGGVDVFVADSATEGIALCRATLLAVRAAKDAEASVSRRQ